MRKFAEFEEKYHPSAGETEHSGPGIFVETEFPRFCREIVPRNNGVNLPIAKPRQQSDFPLSTIRQSSEDEPDQSLFWLAPYSLLSLILSYFGTRMRFPPLTKQNIILALHKFAQTHISGRTNEGDVNI